MMCQIVGPFYKHFMSISAPPPKAAPRVGALFPLPQGILDVSYPCTFIPVHFHTRAFSHPCALIVVALRGKEGKRIMGHIMRGECTVVIGQNITLIHRYQCSRMFTVILLQIFSSSNYVTNKRRVQREN